MEIAIQVVGVSESDAEKINEDLLELPAKVYLRLFREMNKSIYGHSGRVSSRRSLEEEFDNEGE